MTSRSRGSPVTPGLTVCIENAGIVSAASRPPASTTETSGRLSTRSRIAPQTRDSPRVLWRRLATHGTRPFSVQPLRDRNESIAGSTVTEPSIATATTRIVPMPNETNTALPARNMPAIAAITVRPETSTARPEVAAAAFERGVPAAPGVAFLHLAP